MPCYCRFIGDNQTEVCWWCFAISTFLLGMVPILVLLLYAGTWAVLRLDSYGFWDWFL